MSYIACSRLWVSGDDRKAARDKRRTGSGPPFLYQTPIVPRCFPIVPTAPPTESLEQAVSFAIIYEYTQDRQENTNIHPVPENKELKLFKIRNDDVCFQCKSPDSLEHTFLECPRNVQFYQEILSWFNTLNNIHIKLSIDQIFLQNYPPPAINDDLRRRLDFLILLIKRYTYSCKINEKQLNNLQFINKIKMQWKIENLT